MRSEQVAGLLVGVVVALSAPAHAACVKAGDTVSEVAGKLLYGRAALEPGQTFPASAQRGRAGHYYMRPIEPMCVDKGDGEAPVNVDYLWIDTLGLDESLLGNMQGWINKPATVSGVVVLDTRQTGATARIRATTVVQK